MNRFVMTEEGRDHVFKNVSAQMAFTNPDGAERSCKIQVIATHPVLPRDAVLWFKSLKGVRGSTYSLHEEVIESDAGFYLFDHHTLESVKLDLRLEKQCWRLELTCALFSMGATSQEFKVSTDLELCDGFDLECA